MRSTLPLKPLLVVCALLLMAAGVQAQNLTGYRYWFNDDLTTMMVVDIVPTPVLDTELTLNSASLPTGHHLVTIQFRDADGHWSAPWTTTFAQRGTAVSALEYWFNDDPASTVTTNLTPGTAPQYAGALNTSAMPLGFHTITLRAVDSRGVRSVPYTVQFSRNGGAITGYEYWIDDAIADRMSGSIGPDGTVDLIASLPVPTTEGDHLFTIRFRDAEGGWSVPLSRTFSFVVGIDEIPGLSNYLLYPNPASADITLRVDATEHRMVDVDVLDASGRTVVRSGSWSVDGTAHRAWDVSGLAPGRYVLRLMSGDRVMQIPFVKQ